MKKLCIHHHLGLGDHLDCNGMVRHFLKNADFDQIYVFSKSNYFSMIDFMYRDEENIIVVEINKDQNEYEYIQSFVTDNNIDFFLRVGHENYPFLKEHLYDKNCWEFFYDQVKLPYNVRTNDFYFERNREEEQRVYNKLNPENEPFVFVHDDKSRGYQVDRKHFVDSSLKVVENDITENIFYFTKILEEAKEIHCMESSFKSLIDLYAQTDEIFYHDFRNQPLGNYTNKKWNVIKYE
tara:strand:- start:72 stop:782 length:711 start_codon:yes stop_codon:yes gene_type:complete